MGKFIIFINNFTLLAITFLSLDIVALVTPQNYNFSLDNLAPYYPNQKFSELIKTKKGAELIRENGETKLYRFYVAQLRYKFPVFVQVQNDTILDTFAKLPTYFLHDLFHQSLIDRYGQQNYYKKKEMSALYRWDKLPDFTITYLGSCTITCFPQYLSIATKKQQDFKTLPDLINGITTEE